MVNYSIGDLVYKAEDGKPLMITAITPDIIELNGTAYDRAEFDNSIGFVNDVKHILTYKDGKPTVKDEEVNYYIIFGEIKPQKSRFKAALAVFKAFVKLLKRTAPIALIVMLLSSCATYNQVRRECKTDPRAGLPQSHTTTVFVNGKMHTITTNTYRNGYTTIY